MQGEVQHFSSAPQAVGTRKKYRDPNDNDATARNIMHDKRVVKGSTCAPVSAPSPQDTAEVQKQREAHRRRLMRASQTRRRAGTPEPVAGRKHLEIQTDRYLEELTERTVEFEAGTQTDYLLDRPSSPLFMPAKIGVDIETQIEDGELFDFDVECEPLLEILVGKTLELSMMEVLEEEELESLRRHQEDFEKRRNAELLEVQRMEDAEKRRHDEMERRIHQQAEQRKQDLIIMKKVVSRSVAAAHLSSLMERSVAHLQDAGIFSDSLDSAVDATFMPNLLEGVMQQMARGVRDRQLAAEAMQTAVSQRLENNRRAIDAEKRRRAAIDEAERQARVERAENEAEQRREEERMKQEAKALEEWEEYQPPPPPITEVEIVDLIADPETGARKAVLRNDQQVNVDETELPALEELVQKRKELLDNGEEAPQIAGQIDPGPEPDTFVVSKFRELAPGEELKGAASGDDQAAAGDAVPADGDAAAED